MRSWPGTLVVVLALAAYVGGLQWWDRRVPGELPIDSRQALQLGQVRFQPAAGWRLDAAASRFGNSLKLVSGGNSFVVTVQPWEGGAEGAIKRHRRAIERVQKLQVDGEETPFINAWGTQGLTLAYYGPRIAGRWWQIVDLRHSALVLVDFRGHNDGQADALRDARAMLDSMDLSALPLTH